MLGEEDIGSALIGLGDLGEDELGLGEDGCSIGDVEASERSGRVGDGEAGWNAILIKANKGKACGLCWP